MKIIILLICYILIAPFNLKSQINLDSFTRSIIEECKTLEKKRESGIDNFMKYGYKKSPKLKNDSICKIPVYTIFSNSRFVNSDRVKDSLFVYLNPKSLCIDNIFFYKDKRFVAVAHPSYTNVKDQPIGLSNARNAKLADIMIREKPQILFSLSQNDKVYFFIENNSLFCYFFDEKLNNYTQMSPKEFLDIIDESEFYFMTNLDKPIPLIYSK